MKKGPIRSLSFGGLTSQTRSLTCLHSDLIYNQTVSWGFGLFWCLNLLLPLPPPLLPPSAKMCHGCKSSLLSSHQSAGISSMPRSLCAAKREIKETVISSAASAADSCIAVAEWVCEGGAKGCREKMWREGWQRMGQQTVGSTLWYKVLQLSEALWRENTRGRWGCDELRGTTGRELRGCKSHHELRVESIRPCCLVKVVV